MLINLKEKYLKSIKNYEVKLLYDGKIDYKTITSILDEVKEKFSTSNSYKKIYFIANELLENASYYSDTNPNQGVFIILAKAKSYRIIVMNKSIRDHYNFLIKKVDLLNSLKDDEVQLNYFKELKSDNVKEKGTAGVGLSLIRLRSKNKIKISVEDIGNSIVVILDIKIDNFGNNMP